MQTPKKKFSANSILQALGFRKKSWDANYAQTVFQDTDHGFAETVPAKSDPDDYEALEGRYFLGKHVGREGDFLVKRLHIRFIDKAGQITERDIDTQCFLTDGQEGLVLAHCHLRNADQCFTMSRITSLLDLDSGETTNDIANWFITQFAQAQTQQVMKGKE
jgi:hypothetical protein